MEFLSIASRVTVPKNLRSAEVETTITFKPGAGITGLLLEITPRLEVLSVRDPAGEQLPFAQWAFAAERWNPDASLLVRFSDPLPAGSPVSITVAAKGPLFDPFLGGTQQAEEDLWQPRLDDPEGAVHELRCVVPEHTKVAGSGRLLSETVVGAERHVHFETSRPVNHASFYLGPFESYTAKADDTEVELLANYYKDEIADVFGDGTSRPITGENPEYAVQEIANAVRIYNRMLGVRLETPHLRVATTPTGHGRGFDGLILLSKYLGTSGDLSRADLFRAHEVAHQWFGGIVMSKNWPEDRWLTESFAEFVAMEFYDARFQKRDKTMALLKDAWLDPLFMETPSPVRTLTGQTVSMKEGGRRLIDGGQNVYTKGPLVLRHLRYLFTVQKKGDEAFWGLLREFLESHRYGRVSTADFVAAAERKKGGELGWFWDQWVYGSGFPKIKWSHEVSPHPQGGYLLTVQATQEATEFILPIPVHVHMGGEKVLTTHLAMRGKEGKLQVRLKERPKKVTLNDEWMAPVEILN